MGRARSSTYHSQNSWFLADLSLLERHFSNTSFSRHSFLSDVFASLRWVRFADIHWVFSLFASRSRGNGVLGRRARIIAPSRMVHTIQPVAQWRRGRLRLFVTGDPAAFRQRHQ